MKERDAEIKDEIKDNISSRKSGSKRRTGGKGKPRRKFSNKNSDNSTNDPSWYGQSPELLRDAASIPFSWPVGTPLNTSLKFETGQDVVPGVLSISLTPTIGTSLNKFSPVNVASSAIYSWVRHANSGHSNYDAPDLMLYLIAMSNIYSLVTWMQRVYAYASMYDQRNRYLPQAVLEACRVDFADVRDNLANFRYFLNQYINKVASLAVPNTMPIFNRLAFLYANVYIDGPSIKDQLYMYNPADLEWYKFQIGATGAGELVREKMISTPRTSLATVADIETYATTLFNAIWDEEDFGIMSGDIIKAYDSNVIKLAPVPEVMPIAPVYDAMVLHQMKNAKFCLGLEVSKISQSNTGEILQAILIDTTQTTEQQQVCYEWLKSNKVLSTDFDAPTPDVVIESTRLMPAYDTFGAEIYGGTEIPMYIEFYRIVQGSIHVFRFGNRNSYLVDGNPVSRDVFEALASLTSLTLNFKYAPELFYFGVNSTGTVLDYKGYRFWNVDNYAVLSNADLKKMHETALLSLFAVPAIAKIS